MTMGGKQAEQRTAADEIRGVLARCRQSFVAVGVVSTLAYAGLYLLLRDRLAPFAANAAALLLTAVGNTAANRRLTFGVRGPRDRWRHQAKGLVVLAAGLTLTSGSLTLLHAVDPAADRTAEVLVLTMANLLVTIGRFVLMRTWVFARASRPKAERPTSNTPGRSQAI